MASSPIMLDLEYALPQKQKGKVKWKQHWVLRIFFKENILLLYGLFKALDAWIS